MHALVGLCDHAVHGRTLIAHPRLQQVLGVNLEDQADRFALAGAEVRLKNERANRLCQVALDNPGLARDAASDLLRDSRGDEECCE